MGKAPARDLSYMRLQRVHDLQNSERNQKSMALTLYVYWRSFMDTKFSKLSRLAVAALIASSGAFAHAQEVAKEDEI